MQRITHNHQVLEVELDDTFGIRCPACGSDDVQQWADDGESDSADYWQCNDCNADGAMLTSESEEQLAAIASSAAFPAAVEYKLEGMGLIRQTDQPFAIITPLGRAVMDSAPVREP